MGRRKRKAMKFPFPGRGQISKTTSAEVPKVGPQDSFSLVRDRMRKGQGGEILDQLNAFDSKSEPLFGDYNHSFLFFFPFRMSFFEIILILDDTSSLFGLVS